MKYVTGEFLQIKNELLHEWNILKKYLLKNKWFIIASVVLFLLMYLPWLTHIIPRIDGEVLINTPYYEDGYITNGRQGSVYTDYFFGMRWYDPFFSLISGFLMYCLVGIMLGYFCYRLGAKEKSSSWFGLICMSSPVMIELFYFDMCVFKVGWTYVITVAAAILTVYCSYKKRFWGRILSIPFLIWSISTYEILAIVYAVTIVVAFLLMYFNWDIKKKKEQKTSVYIKMIIDSVLVLIVSFVLNIITTRLFFASANSEYLAAKIQWGQFPFEACVETIKLIIKSCLFGDGKFYTLSMLITGVVVVCCLLYYVIKERFRKLSVLFLLSGLILQISPYFLIIALGGSLDVRAHITYPLVLTFNIILIFTMINKKILTFMCGVLTVCTVWMQAQRTMRLEYTDFVRAEEDIRLAEQINEHIDQVTSDKTKPIYIDGMYTSKLNNACLRGQIIGISVFGFTGEYAPRYCFSTTRACEVMRTLGYNRNYITDAGMIDEARKTAIDMPVFPKDGSVVDTGAYVIVKLNEDDYLYEDNILEPKVSKLTGIETEEPSENLTIELDKCTIENDVLMLYGWAYCSGTDSAEVNRDIFLYDDEDNYYEIATCRVKRDDLLEYFNSARNLYSGYYAKAKITELPDNYSSMKLGIKIVMPDGTERYVKSDKAVGQAK